MRTTIYLNELLKLINSSPPLPLSPSPPLSLSPSLSGAAAYWLAQIKGKVIVKVVPFPS